MKAIKLILVFLLFIFISALIYYIPRINFNPLFADIKIDKKFYDNYFPETIMPAQYNEISGYEDIERKKFPRTKPGKVILTENTKFLKTKNELSEYEIQELLRLLNDSSNYEWGELGTPEVHYYFEFFNDKKELIGFTKVDLEGMAYSEPYLGKMKWCAFNKIDALEKLISEIEE